MDSSFSMKHHLLRYTLLGIAGSLGASAFAQGDIPFILTSRPEYTISAAVRVRTGGANVKFGKLGTAYRQYTNGGAFQFDDGYVYPDAQRAEEKITGYSPSGLAFVEHSADGKRYFIYTVSKDTNGVETGRTLTSDLVAYQDGMTRDWSYDNASQVENGYVNMHYRYATAEDASGEADSGSSAGVDITINRDLGMIGKNFQWGFAASVGINDINAKMSGEVRSTLHIMTQKFSLAGQPAPTRPDDPTTPDVVESPYPYTAPVYGPIYGSDGTTVISTLGKELTTPLTVTPEGQPVDQTIPGGALVKGYWQVKGAYYLLRLGPSFRWQIHRRFSLSGSVGVAGAYLGSVYKAEEEMIDPEVKYHPGYKAELRMRKFMPGYYGELNAEFWMTYRTGLFVGGVFEKVGDYEQTLANRTAKVEVGSGLAYRFGVVHRF